METNKTIKCLLLVTKEILITEIEEVTSELGEPDCKLSNPYKVTNISELTIIPWLMELTDQTELMISSDKILTIIEPTKLLLDKYLEILH